MHNEIAHLLPGKLNQPGNLNITLRKPMHIETSKPHATISLIFLLVIFSFLSGCSKFNCTRLEKYLGEETDLIAFSYIVADELTEAAFPPLTPHDPARPLLVTTFVDNNDLTQTSHLGRILQEHIRSRLVQLGYTVKDIKMTGKLLIEPKSGETILSRDLQKIKPVARGQAILVGTFSISNRTLYVSARFVNPVDNSIVSSNDYRLCMDENILAMFGLMHETGGGNDIKEPGRPALNSILY